MASTTTRAMMRLPASSIGFSTATGRSFATSSRSFTRARPTSRILLERSKLHQNSRRAYADIAPAKRSKRFPFFKTLWRLTYISAIAGTAYLAYGVYDLRHPDDQFEPDPTKKNLVILGTDSIDTLYSYQTASDSSQELDGVLSLFSRSSIPKITMLSSSLHETTFSSLLFYHHAQPEQSNIDLLWSRFEV